MTCLFSFFYRSTIISRDSSSSTADGGMWISADQVDSVLKHHWYTTPMTESTKRYVLYRNHFNVDVYTLRFNINSPNFSKETMLDTLIRKVMNHFPKARTVVGSISYDMLLVDAKDQNNPSYYLWRANSNQRSASNTEETVLTMEQHQLYLFGRKAANVDVETLNVDFQSSSMVVADILTLVFTFSSA
jgi:hypothetical protein